MYIKINGDIWLVRTVEGKKKKMNPEPGKIRLGLTEYLNGVINIRKGMTENVTRSTVIHELVHAFIFSYGHSVDGEEPMCNFFGAHGDDIIHLTDEIMEEVRKECLQKPRSKNL